VHWDGLSTWREGGEDDAMVRYQKKAGRQAGREEKRGRERERVGAYSTVQAECVVVFPVSWCVVYFFFFFVGVVSGGRECRVAVRNYIGRAFIFIIICGDIFTYESN
jgi:hypothetical protein